MSSGEKKQPWWQSGVIYHIYPRSFYDSNNDGIGDLKGIIQKIDYLKKLGIDAIWLSPVYPSPQYDFGYDVSDYKDIHEAFGTMDDLKELIRIAHKHHIKVIMDMVLNHTSDKHSWFIESASSIHNPKRDWYIWERSGSGKKPNNWKTIFGGSGWTFDKKTNAYYFHSCFRQQPDLNWRNPKVWTEFKKIMKFWLDMGVDGFRFDVINLIIKDKKLRDNPKLFSFFRSDKKLFNRNRPGTLKILKKIRTLLDDYGDKVSLGEIYTLPPGDPELAASYLGENGKGLHLTFDFSLIFTQWSARRYARCIEHWYQKVPKSGWPALVLSNHDLFRHANRFPFSLKSDKKMQLKAALLLLLKGTPVLYYGDEIGMENVRIRRKELKDPLGKKFWPFYSGRDKSRTPMQWNLMENAGFSKVKPWLPVSPDYKKVNVENQLSNNQSILWFYIRLIKLRKQSLVLQKGDIEFITKGRNGIMAFVRFYKKEKYLVIFNFRKYAVHYENFAFEPSRILISNTRKPKQWFGSLKIKLEPYEAIVFTI